MMMAACGSTDEGDQAAVELSATPAVSVTPAPSPSPTLPPGVTPPPTACVPNPEWEDTYIVEQGDTLGGIAVAAGTTIRDLELSNCLGDRDFLVPGQELRIPNAFAVDLAQSPEGAEGVIVFVRDNDAGERDLWSVKSDGTTLSQISENGYVIGPLVRSPDLNRVAYQVVSEFHMPDENTDIELERLPADLWAVDVDGTNPVQLVNQGPRDRRLRSLPDWSPDSSQLAFTEQNEGQQIGSLVVIQPDGSGRFVQMTGDFVGPAGLPVAPDWSPDGSQLAYMEFSGDGAGLYLLDVSTGEFDVLLEQIDYQVGPYWVPRDGRGGPPAIAFADADGWAVIDPLDEQIYPRPGGRVMVNIGLNWLVQPRENGLAIFNTERLQMTVNAADFNHLSWGREGGQFVLQTDEGLRLVDLSAGTEFEVTTGNDHFPVWTEPLWLVLP